jgi:hypothetical protein
MSDDEKDPIPDTKIIVPKGISKKAPNFVAL